MKNSLTFLAFWGFSLAIYAQDSLKTERNELLSRFESITGKEPNYKDSLALSQKKLQNANQKITVQQDSIQVLNAQLIALDKALLIAKYGQPDQHQPYGAEQVKDFTQSRFLSTYFNSDEAIRIFFALDETTIDLSLYKQKLDELVESLKNNPKKKLVIQGYADNIGDDKVNLTLSNERVQFVKKYLMENYQLPESQFKISYYGKGGNDRVPEKELDFLNRQVSIRIQ